MKGFEEKRSVQTFVVSVRSVRRSAAEGVSSFWGERKTLVNGRPDDSVCKGEIQRPKKIVWEQAI